MPIFAISLFFYTIKLIHNQMKNILRSCRLKAALCLLLVFSAMPCVAKDVSLKSPNKQVVAMLTQQAGQTYLDVQDGSGRLFMRISLGLTTSDEDYTSLTLSKVGRKEVIRETYSLLHGKTSRADNACTALQATYLNPEGQPLTVEVRAWNDGVTFRYLLPDNGKEREFTGETTAFDLPNKPHCWLQKFTTSYEDDYRYQEQPTQQGDWGYPCLFQDFDRFLLITEANPGRQYCNTHLNNSQDARVFKVNYPFPWEGNRVGEVNPRWKGEWTSPWRVVIVGDLATVTASTLVEDCSEPCKVEDTSWIKPGGSAWVYWAYNHGTRDFQICKQYVDLAHRMGWPYVLFDWEWDTMRGGGTIEDACRYALSQGVKPLMWYNSGGPHTGVMSTPRDRMLTHESRMKEFAWLKSIGVVGVKVDFFESDKQHMMNYFLDILEDAAEAHIMVNFHGATIPRGWTRTYPHLMSTEGVYGAEQYNNGRYMTENGCHVNCVLPFTRNVVGPMDYTPVAFTHSQHPHTTSYAHELALSVIFESGIQHWADRPSGFYDLPDVPRQFMMHVPTAWDETRLLDGYPAEHVVMARRKGSSWYVAGLEGKSQPTTFKVRMDFLDPDHAYELTLIGDGAQMDHLRTSRLTVRRDDILEVPCISRGGFAMHLKPLSSSR